MGKESEHSFGADDKGIIQSDTLRFRSLYDTLFLHRSVSGTDAGGRCSVVFADTCRRSGCIWRFLVPGGNGIPLFWKENEMGDRIVYVGLS